MLSKVHRKTFRRELYPPLTLKDTPIESMLNPSKKIVSSEHYCLLTIVYTKSIFGHKKIKFAYVKEVVRRSLDCSGIFTEIYRFNIMCIIRRKFDNVPFELELFFHDNPRRTHKAHDFWWDCIRSILK